MTFKRIQISKFGDPNVMKLVTEAELPKPAAGQVRIRVIAASAAMTDTMVRRGRYPGIGKKQLPLTPGYDIAGLVDEVGEGVSEFAIGDMVADMTITGGYSQYMCVNSDRLTKVPSGISPARATASVLTYLTAYQMLHRIARVKRGQTVLVHAAGGAVGSALIQLGKLHELRMIATASHAKHDFVRSLGAEPIDCQSIDFRQGIRNLGLNGVDAVFDCTTPENFNRSYDVLNQDGLLVFFGVQMSRSGIWEKMILPFSFMRLFMRDLMTRKRSKVFYSIETMRDQNPEWFKKDWEKIFDLLAQGGIDPIIQDTIALADVQSAHRQIEAGAIKGKFVILMDDTA